MMPHAGAMPAAPTAERDPPMRPDYRGLEAFVAIADLGSFNRAADYLNLSTTALSHRIKKLEGELGVQLLLRSTRDVSLTKEAQRILPGVRHSLRDLAEVYAGLIEEGRARESVLAFACIPTLAYNYLPRILHAFSREFPEIAVHLHDRQISRVYEMVESGAVEFGISIVGARRWNLDVREIHTEPYVLFVRRDHPLAERPSVTRADLEGLPFAQITSQSSNRQLVHDALGDYRERIRVRYHVQNPAMALSLVAEGAAVTILPRLMANLAWADLVALPFADVRIRRTLGLVTRRGAALSVPAQRLVGMVTEALEQS